MAIRQAIKKTLKKGKEGLEVASDFAYKKYKGAKDVIGRIGGFSEKEKASMMKGIEELHKIPSSMPEEMKEKMKRDIMRKYLK